MSSLFLGLLLLMLGGSLLGIVVPLKLKASGISTELTRQIMAAYFAGLLAGSVYAQRVIVQVGHIRSFACFAAIMAASALALPLLFDVPSWAVLRFLAGFCVAGLFAALESWLNERTTNETRGRVLGVYMVVNYSAILAGQLMVNLYALESVEAFTVAALLIILCLVPVVLTRVQAPDLQQVQPLSLRALYASSPLAVVGTFTSGMILGAYYGMGAVFAQEVGFSVFQVSLFTGSVILGALLLQWPIGRLSDRFDRRTVLLCMLVAAVLVCGAGIGTRWVEARFAPLLLLGLLLGPAITSIYPIAISQAYDYLPAGRYVAASSGLLLAYSIGATAGPVLSSVAMAQLDPFAFFGFIAVAAAGLALFLLYRMWVREALPAGEQEVYAPLQPTSPIAAELDPRTEAGADEGSVATTPSPAPAPSAGSR